MRACAINRLGERLCLEHGVIPVSRLAITDPQAGFSSDGFHASEAGYRSWAEHMLDVVVDEAAPPTSRG